MQQLDEAKRTIDGELVARYFKYYLQQKNTYVVFKLPLHKVAVKTFYSQHKCAFDKIANISNNYGLAIDKYVEYFVIICNKFEKNIDLELASIDTIYRYVEHRQIKTAHERIYKYFMKSVDNIVADCIRLKYNNVIDYLRYLIKNRILSNYFISGKISIYYFAAIPNFKNVIEKLDQISKDEFSQLYTRYEKYNVDINEAFKQMKNIRINPIKYTNDMILKARNV